MTVAQWVSEVEDVDVRNGLGLDLLRAREVLHAGKKYGSLRDAVLDNPFCWIGIRKQHVAESFAHC